MGSSASSSNATATSSFSTTTKESLLLVTYLIIFIGGFFTLLYTIRWIHKRLSHRCQHGLMRLRMRLKIVLGRPEVTEDVEMQRPTGATEMGETERDQVDLRRPAPVASRAGEGEEDGQPGVYQEGRLELGPLRTKGVGWLGS